MDVDAPNILKRCSSAPLINEASSTAVTSPTTTTAPRNTPFFSVFSNNNLRTRRHSSTFSSLAATSNLTQNSWTPRLTPRVNQLRAEECADVSNTREMAHERELHNTMQMGQSYEDLTLVGGLSNSPTRIPRFSPVVSPSPTRKYTTRRSLSPIPLRASGFSPVSRPAALGGKRRALDHDSPLTKRMCGERLTPTTPGTPDSDCVEFSIRATNFRPVSPRAQPMADVEAPDHKATSHS